MLFPMALPVLKLLNKAECSHELHVVGSGEKAAEHPSFKLVNTILGQSEKFAKKEPRNMHFQKSIFRGILQNFNIALIAVSISKVLYNAWPI
jgi:hypothetical protein